MSLDTRIDDLYGLPLGEFTASRNALAKTLSGDEAKRVRSLTKPTVVPWAVNQLFWKARPVYDRLLKGGAALRDAQIETLKGRAADVQRATDAHRRALADAVHRASELASAEGSHPDADGLTRMLEALSLSAESPNRPGRLTELLQPAGFEALAGVQPVAARGKTESAVRSTDAATNHDASRSLRRREEQPRQEAEREETERKQAERKEAERRRLEANVRSTERAVTEAKATEAQAREALDRALEERRAAEAALAAARKAVT